MVFFPNENRAKNTVKIGKSARNPVSVFQTVGGPDGYYDRQHDSVLTCPAAPLTGKGALRRLFAEAAKQLKDALPWQTLYSSGSTAAVAHLSPEGVITTAHTGDSRITLFVRHRGAGIVNAFRLTRDHSPLLTGERRRIEAAGGRIEDGYLTTDKGALAVTRAFGDTALRPYVLCQPAVHQYRLDDPRFAIAPGDEAFLCVDSDGAHADFSAAIRARALKDFLADHDWRDAPRFLADRAVAGGSGDNISVIFAALAPPRGQDMLLGVFDGHGNMGYKVSSQLAHLVKGIAQKPF